MSARYENADGGWWHRPAVPHPSWPHLQHAAATASVCRHGAREDGSLLPIRAKQISACLPLPSCLRGLPSLASPSPVYNPEHYQIGVLCLNIHSLIKIQSCFRFSPSCILVEICN